MLNSLPISIKLVVSITATTELSYYNYVMTVILLSGFMMFFPTLSLRKNIPYHRRQSGC